MSVVRILPVLAAGLLVAISPVSASQEGASYTGSKSCQKCHQKQFKEWKHTLHAQMVKDVKKHSNAIVGDFDSASEVRTFNKEQVLYTIGNQWKQRYITRIDDEYYILPAQYNLETGEWAPYHADNWKERPWLKKCGGCHVTGLDYDNRSFAEPAVGCEACHGPGGRHVNAKKQGDYEKTIVNPATLPVGLQVQVCGSCHTRGKDPSGKHGYPADFKPGMTLVSLYKPVTPEEAKKRFWPNGHSKSHHQQYLDWQGSTHAKEGVTCISCHTVHSTGAATRYQTRLPGNKLCLNCHTLSKSPSRSHSLHDFNNCIGCHMSKIVKSAVSGDLHDHTFRVVLPNESMQHGGLKKQPNSCNTCHYHKDHKPEDLQKALDAVKVNVAAKGTK